MSRPQPKVIMTPEMEEKFESELLWCIQQLQNSLKSGKLSKKAAESSVKSLNVLMGKSSIVKKRQTMRVLFGDYRAKMLQEEKKLSENNLKIIVKPAQPHKNSKCLKRHIPKQTSEAEALSKNISQMKISDEEKNFPIFKFVPSDNSFRFNFEEKSD